MHVFPLLLVREGGVRDHLVVLGERLLDLLILGRGLVVVDREMPVSAILDQTAALLPAVVVGAATHASVRLDDRVQLLAPGVDLPLSSETAHSHSFSLCFGVYLTDFMNQGTCISDHDS